MLKREIVQLLSVKADKKELYDNLGDKIGMGHIQECKNFIKILHNNVKHLAVLSKEQLINAMKKSTSTEHEIANTNSNLISQIDSVYKLMWNLDTEFEASEQSKAGFYNSPKIQLKPIKLK